MKLSNGRMLRIEVKKSKRAKQYWLKANISEIYLIAPTVNYEITQVMRFLDSKKEWILKTLEYYERVRSNYVEANLKSGTISFLGKRYNLQITKDIAPSVIVSDNLSKITFHVTDRRKYKDDLKQWYFEQTRRIVSERLDLIRKRNSSLPANNKVSIKNQRSRWASCSENGNLNFNLILAALPIEIIDYVIIHELAHLIELNHSKDFWNIVKMTDPEFQTHRKLLHKYRYEL
ncbi:MAG TPA: SprT family zinc-dependent metalloprotease [Candidatus Nitrosopolaris sp.]